MDKKEELQEPRTGYTAASEEPIGGMPVAEMTTAQLETLIRRVLKEALQEVLEDPDVGLEVRPEFEKRLRRATDYVAAGGRLLSIEELTGELEGAGGV
jgi:hypothetical protein